MVGQANDSKLRPQEESRSAPALRQLLSPGYPVLMVALKRWVGRKLRAGVRRCGGLETHPFRNVPALTARVTSLLPCLRCRTLAPLGGRPPSSMKACLEGTSNVLRVAAGWRRAWRIFCRRQRFAVSPPAVTRGDNGVALACMRQTGGALRGKKNDVREPLVT